MPKVVLTELRAFTSFSEGLATQQRLGADLENNPKRIVHLILLQHQPVYTLGRTTQAAHLIQSPDELKKRTGAEVVEVARGGSVTYHGPGQLTAYLVLNLKSWGHTIHQHLWNLEEAAIRTLTAFGINGQRVEGRTGIWVRPLGFEKAEAQGPLAKVCAIGVGSRKWVTYHGLGLNVDLDLTPFNEIDPCGLGRQPVTSMAHVLGRKLTCQEVAHALSNTLTDLYSEIDPSPSQA